MNTRIETTDNATDPSDPGHVPDPEGRIIVWRYVGQPDPFRVIGQNLPLGSTILGAARAGYVLHPILDNSGMVRHPVLPLDDSREVANEHEVDIAITATAMLAAAGKEHGARPGCQYAQENGFALPAAFGADADLALHWLTRWNLAEGRRCPSTGEARLHLTSDGVDVAGRLLRLHRWVEGQIEALHLLLDTEGQAPAEEFAVLDLGRLSAAGLVRVVAEVVSMTASTRTGMERLKLWLPAGHSMGIR